MQYQFSILRYFLALPPQQPVQKLFYVKIAKCQENPIAYGMKCILGKNRATYSRNIEVYGSLRACIVLKKNILRDF
jgi:hypothetical protein